MSLQKVVSNYYVDLLDYLGTKYRKYEGSFEKYFDNITPEGKKQLVNKIASVFQRVDILRNSQAQFWKSRQRNQSAYKGILIAMIIVSCITMYWLLLEDLRGAGMSSYQKRAAMLSYTIVFLIIFTIFLLIILNIQENLKQSKAKRDETDTDIVNLQNLLDMDEDLQMIFRFIGYKSTESKTAYSAILRRNEARLNPYIIKADVSAPKNKKTKVNEGDKFNYILFFDQNRNQLLTKLNLFYDNGLGYIVLRKEVVASSNILIFKEFSRIMEYYYKLVKRKNNAKLIENNKVTDVLDKYVISEITLVSKVLAPLNVNAYVDVTDDDIKTRSAEIYDAISMNYNNPVFMRHFLMLDLFLSEITVYGLQIYLRKSARDADFDPLLKAIMPQFLEPDTLGELSEFFTGIKSVFLEHEKTKLPKMIEDAKKTAGSFDTLYIALFTDFQGYLNPLYQNLMIHIQGDYYFIFSKWFYQTLALKEYEKNSDLIKQILGETDKNPTDFDKYYKEFLNAYANTYIGRYWLKFKSEYQSLDYRKNMLVSKISANMVKFDKIRLMENQSYILGKVQNTPETVPVITEIMMAVDQDVRNRKLVEMTSIGNKGNAARFLDVETFIEELDKISYIDFKVGLNLEFYTDILDRFYFSVNNSIYSGGNSGNKTSKDIYFTTNKNFKLAKWALIFGITIICLCLVYNSMRVFEDWKLAKLAKQVLLGPEAIKNKNDSEVKYITREYRENHLNILMKGFIPVAFGVFFICLLMSIYKKSQAKFRFNKETIDANTSELRSALAELRVIIEDLDIKINRPQQVQVIKNIKLLGVEEKTNIYEKLKIVIDKFEKCNYVLASQKNDLPFPYTEIIIDAFMISVILLCLFWVLGQINPVERIRTIKTLNKMKEEGQYNDSSVVWTTEMVTMASCHDNEMDSIMFTLKIMFFLFIVLFLIFYATKILTSTSDFEFGIYNSMYFEESICIE